jgi:DNA-binding IclR family transcriptional regulator
VPAQKDGSPTYHVPAVARALAVLELLASRNEPQRLSSMARELGLPKSSCFTILATLEREGVVRKHEEDDAWSVTLWLYYLGLKAAAGTRVVALSQPVLEQLRDTTSLTAHLGLLDGTTVRYAVKVEAHSFVQFDTAPGKTARLHLTALARAVAAHVPPETLQAMLRGYRLTGGTGKAFTSRKAFERELEQVRERGWALEDEEETLGVRCLAAPVTDGGGRCIGAVGVTGLVGQLDDPDRLAPAVVAAARAVSNRL